MRLKFLAYVILCIHSRFLLFAANEIQYSSDYVDQATGTTWQEIRKQASATNPDIQTANRKVLEAKTLRRLAAVFPNPELQISAGTSSILGEAGDREWSAGITQTFELAGKRSKRIRAADLSVQIAEQELRERERQVRWELQQAFAEVLSSAATIHTTQEALILNEQSHAITLARVQQGETAAVEKAVSEVELNRLKADLATLRAEATRSTSKLKTLTGTSQTIKIRTTQLQLLELNPDQLVSLALFSRPDYKVVVLQTELSKSEIALARAEGISDLDAFVEFRNEHSAFDQLGINSSGVPVPLIDQDKNLSAGISIPLPFFNRNQGNTQVAEIRAEAAQIRKNAMETIVRQEVQVAIERFRIAQANFLMFRDTIMDQSDKQLTVLQASYRAGELRFLDLINEQKRALEIRKSYINSAKEYFTALAEVEFATAAQINGGSHE